MERSLGTVVVTDPPPRNPLSLRRQLTAIRMFDSGPAALRDAGGQVTRLHLGPRWLVPPVVVATSPRAARDILSRSPEEMERNRVHEEMRDLLGPNLFDLQYRNWGRHGNYGRCEPNYRFSCLFRLRCHRGILYQYMYWRRFRHHLQ